MTIRSIRVFRPDEWHAADPDRPIRLEAARVAYVDLNEAEAQQLVATLADVIREGQTSTDEPDRALVLAGCGHWWRESRPAGLRIDPDAPRVCTQCRPDHPAAVGVSPQGLALVRVTYLPGSTPLPGRAR